jgi:membrane protein YqaA with SNARE-associated domain
LTVNKVQARGYEEPATGSPEARIRKNGRAATLLACALFPLPNILLPGLRWLGDNIAGLGTWLMTLGPPGLFLISLLDSAFIPLPSGPDLVMIALSAITPSLMPVYALAATLGSAIGSVLLYLAARRAGARALRGISLEKRERVENLLGRYDMLAVMLPAVLPPPFPFKVFVLSAGVFKLRTYRFIVAILIGRAARFLIEGWLAIEFGKDAHQLVLRQGPRIVVAAGAVVLVTLAVKFYRLRRARSGA